MSEKRKRIGNIDFRAFVEIFNTHGKATAVKHVTETYGVRYDTIVKRLRQDSEYIFDQSRDRYVFKSSDNTGESQFLSMEELCSNEKRNVLPNSHSVAASDKIILSLIKDKFFEISNYVTLENSSRKIILKLELEKRAGYEIEYL